jgi:hypothetical protein
MGHTWVSMLGWVAIIATCLFAWLKGGPAERHGAVWLLVCEFAGDAVIGLSSPSALGVWMLGVDFALAVGLLILALAHSSIWLGAAMLLQSVALATHALVMGGEGPAPLTIMIINNAVSELMLVCIAAATALSWRARWKASRPQARSPALSPPSFGAMA